MDVIGSPGDGRDDGRLAKLMIIFPSVEVNQLNAALRQSSGHLEGAIDLLLDVSKSATGSTDSSATAISSAPSIGHAAAAAPGSLLLEQSQVDKDAAALAQMIRQFLAEGDGEALVADLVRRLLDGAIDIVQFVETLPARVGVGQMREFGVLARSSLQRLRERVLNGSERIDIGQSTRGCKRRAVDGPPDAPPPKRPAAASAWPSTSAAASHSPDRIIERVRLLVAAHPQINADMLYNRLEEAADLDAAARLVVDELQASAVAAPSQPATSGAAPAAEFLDDAERAALSTVCQVFPDADPHFVVEQLVQSRQSCDQLVDRMTSSVYPKYKDRLKKEASERRRAQLLDVDVFDITEFLLLFEAPENYFTAADRPVSGLYSQHARVFMLNRYRNMQPTHIDACLADNGGRLLPTVRSIEQQPSRGRRRSPRSGVIPAGGFYARRGRRRVLLRLLPTGQERTEPAAWPEQVDERFFREVQFILNEAKIKAFIQEREGVRAVRALQARENKELQECQCCFAGDVLPEETVMCENGAELHVFCRACVREHAETQIADGKHEIGCPAAGCDEHYAAESLRALIRPASYAQLLRRCQQHELRVADIANLELCPACDFAMIIEGDEERVFRCHNPDCLKETCRQCKEPSHVPLKCDELERDAETRMRTFVENRMADAMIRVCPKCGNRIMRQSGCNHMKCPCGARFCYACRKLHKECRCGGAEVVVHTAEAELAGRDAREAFLQQTVDAERVRIRTQVNVAQLVDPKLRDYA